MGLLSNLFSKSRNQSLFSFWVPHPPNHARVRLFQRLCPPLPQHHSQPSNPRHDPLQPRNQPLSYPAPKPTGWQLRAFLRLTGNTLITSYRGNPAGTPARSIPANQIASPLQQRPADWRRVLPVGSRASMGTGATRWRTLNGSMTMSEIGTAPTPEPTPSGSSTIGIDIA